MDMESKNHWYNKNLRDFAHQNRSEMTKAEACLWKYVLCRRKMRGYLFRRQRPVLKYIADFMCKELMLIIEVDGLTHEWEEVAVNDKKRQQALEKIGFTVLRFVDDEVLTSINLVLYRIEEYTDQFELKNKIHPL